MYVYRPTDSDLVIQATSIAYKNDSVYYYS